ncbi:hypothetical protein J5X84_15055 [Streptosporangiaceae bacterium NEAU-GS5]|nr:hypothetical protein [Streptosporangiaceae bacterium NEAU-GS5]
MIRMMQDPYKDAAGVLRRAIGWEMSPARWEKVTEILSALESALEKADDEDLRRATVQLKLASPTRITRITGKQDADVKEPPPGPIRERLNRLVHELASHEKDVGE